MTITRRPTLRRLLTLPYMVPVLLSGSIIGLFSYRAGSATVDTLSELALNETVERVVQTVEGHIADADVVLEVAFPSDVPAPRSIGADLERLRERLWLAATLHRDSNGSVYYGNRRGQFVGLRRRSETEAELRLRSDPISPGSIHRFSRDRGAPRNPILGLHVPDPRELSWFKAARSSARPSWTTFHIDSRTQELVGTRARRVNDADGRLAGVVATDVPLRHLSDFLETLALSENGVAFLVGHDGNLLATSRGSHLREGFGDGARRLKASRSEDPLLVATYTAVRRFVREDDPGGGAATGSFEGPDGGTVRTGFARLRDAVGPDWMVAVATPREDFMRSVIANARRTLGLTLVACALTVLTGLIVLKRFASDLRQLARTVRRMGDGDLATSVPTDREDEIGELAKSFIHLQGRLLTDRLTGIANRGTMMRKLEDRLVHHGRGCDERPFALLFVDLDRIKSINERFGHEVGDRVLGEVSLRLAHSVRERDTVARFGGDEFLVLLDEVGNRADALRISTHLQAVLARRYETIAELSDEAMLYSRGASIGIALWPEDGRDVETLLKRAHAKMYVRKTGSRTLPSDGTLTV